MADVVISSPLTATFNRFIFLKVEASKVKLLEAKAKNDVAALTHLIKGALSGEVGSVVRRFFDSK